LEQFKLNGRELEMHPILAIFALMVGAAVGGFAGVYLVLPIRSSYSSHLAKLVTSRDQERHVLSAVATVHGQATGMNRRVYVQP
jgi:hypothetical protein